MVRRKSTHMEQWAFLMVKCAAGISVLTEFAERQKLTAGYFTAIGALKSALFGWFDPARKAYRNIPINHAVRNTLRVGHAMALSK